MVMFIYGRIIARFPILKDVGAGNMFGSTSDNFLLSTSCTQPRVAVAHFG
jgi:hypothetical protein